MENAFNQIQSKMLKTPEERLLYGPQGFNVPNISLGQNMIDSIRSNTSVVIQVNAETEKILTNEELLIKSVKLAEILKEIGVKIGDRLSIISENHDNWIIAMCATLYVGGVLAPLNPTYTEYEMRKTLNIVKPNVIFVSRRSEKLLVKMLPTLSWSVELIELDDQPITKKVRVLKTILEEHKAITDPYLYRPVYIEDNNTQPAVILFSSGTTGLPKGVALSHRNLHLYVAAARSPVFFNLHKNDKFLVFLPFFHGYAFSIMISSIVDNLTIVKMSTFHKDIFINAIKKYHITHLPLVPTVLVLIVKDPALSNCNFNSLREVLCAAAPFPKRFVVEAKKRLNVPYIRNGYGMTEFSVMLCMSNRNSKNEEALDCFVSDVVCKVVDSETMKILPSNTVGELCVKGDRMMLGYYNDPTATQKMIKDGWLHTGDLCYYDKQKHIYIVDRLKDLIKYKGYQVAPKEIETILLLHPAVKEAAVIGKLNEICGEVPVAFVVKQPDTTITEQELVDFVKQNLSPQKWLRGGVHFVSVIPKNSNNKILRRELRNLLSKL